MNKRYNKHIIYIKDVCQFLIGQQIQRMAIIAELNWRVQNTMYNVQCTGYDGPGNCQLAQLNWNDNTKV